MRETLEVKSKVWLEVDGEAVLGLGRKMLLEAIHRHGSISRAAREVGISFRKAWGYIHSMEEFLNTKLVETRVGGKGGGGASLTAEARDLLAHYDKLLKGVNEAIDERFHEIFG
ncbi:MAG: LysR family transcriptional regulator [candidate division NC10 bacterium]|nr:LysR family transcriptional regulator [candidate division NC10 bacterium]